MNESLLLARPEDEAFGWLSGRVITVGQFLGDVSAVADALPTAAHVINLCADRYTFAVVFFAVITRQQTNLLPAKRDLDDAKKLRQTYQDCIVVGDDVSEDVGDVESAGLDHCVRLDAGGNGSALSPSIDPDQIAAIAFTSGSTGLPQSHAKTWRMLSQWRYVHWSDLPGEKAQLRGLVATVPSWHMYGLEWTVMLPTVAPICVNFGADFFPSDVVDALDAFASAKVDGTVLVSTPLHLRALCKARQPQLPVSAVLCATAPLDDALVSDVERHLRTQIHEIYGCSEIGSLASRAPGRSEDWRFFDCFDVRFDQGKICIDHPELAEPVVLADTFRRNSTGQYEFVGRAADIVKVAGKRESLAKLNMILTRIDGVEDGVFYDPETLGMTRTGRLGALVVSSGLTVPGIRAQLVRELDAAFLPRPIRIVDCLPRDKTSKLSHDALKKLLTEVDD